MFDSESPLDRCLLDALNDDGHPAPPEARARVRARLAAVIPAMRTGSGTGGPAAPAARTHAPPFFGRPIAALATFAAGAMTGIALYSSYGPSSGAQRVVYLEHPIHADASPAPGPESPADSSGASGGVSSPRDAVNSATSVPRSSAIRKPVQTAPSRALVPPPSRVSSLAAERMLLDEARAGLIQGNPERALANIDMHRKKYPDGQLAQERDALEVEALARAGRFDDARRAAAAFHARTPQDSIFAPTVEGALLSIP